MRHNPIHIFIVFYLLTCRELVSIRIALELLLPKHGNKPLERAIHWGKNLYKADSVKKKISKLHDRVREAKLGFVVCILFANHTLIY